MARRNSCRLGDPEASTTGQDAVKGPSTFIPHSPAVHPAAEKHRTRQMPDFRTGRNRSGRALHPLRLSRILSCSFSSRIGTLLACSSRTIYFFP
jgi:hypothetical protein